MLGHTHPVNPSPPLPTIIQPSQTRLNEKMDWAGVTFNICYLRFWGKGKKFGHNFLFFPYPKIPAMSKRSCFSHFRLKNTRVARTEFLVTMKEKDKKMERRA